MACQRVLLAGIIVVVQMALRAVPEEPLTRPGAPPGMYASAYRSLAAVAAGLVQARLRLLHNNTAGALDALREAAAVEDSLGYMEPPRWGGGGGGFFFFLF
jgi:hypothetical protein